MEELQIKIDNLRKRKITYKIDDNECHTCTSHKPHSGYPRVNINGRPIRIINFIYRQKIGKIPEGYTIVLKCKNPLCINPKHLGLKLIPIKSAEEKYNGYCRNCGEYGSLMGGFCRPSCRKEYTDLTTIPLPKGMAGKIFGFKVYLEIYKIRRDIDDLIILEEGERFYIRTPKIHVLSTKEEKLHIALKFVVSNEFKFLNLLGFLATHPSLQEIREFYYKEVLEENIYRDRKNKDLFARRAHTGNI